MVSALHLEKLVVSAALDDLALFKHHDGVGIAQVDRSALSNELCKMRDEGLLSFHKNRFSLK